MNKDYVTRPEFNIYINSQKEINGNLKELVVEIRRTNSLLRDDITKTHKTQQDHITQYNIDKALTSKEMADIKEKVTKTAETLVEREGVYKLGSYLKLGITIFLTAAITAAGAKFWGLF